MPKVRVDILATDRSRRRRRRCRKTLSNCQLMSVFERTVLFVVDVVVVVNYHWSSQSHSTSTVKLLHLMMLLLRLVHEHHHRKEDEEEEEEEDKTETRRIDNFCLAIFHSTAVAMDHSFTSTSMRRLLFSLVTHTHTHTHTKHDRNCRMGHTIIKECTTRASKQHWFSNETFRML